MKTGTIKSILAAAALFGAVAHGAEEIVVTEAEGWGATREIALHAACEDGVRKVNGFLFSSTATRETVFEESAETEGGASRRQSSMQSLTDRETQAKVKGAIKGYDVLSCEPDDHGGWHAVLQVQVAKYKTPGIDPNSRRKLVVTPFSVLSDSFPIGGQNVSAKETANAFRDKLEQFLVQSRRFTVLGRQDTEAILAEKRLILSESADVGEYAKIGATLGTDYLVCGKVAEVAVLSGTTQSPFTGAAIPRILRARAVVNYRILVMPTAQVKWADEVVVDLPPDQCKLFGGDDVVAYEALLDALARGVCDQALGNIYPVRVARMLDNGEVVLNQGGGLIWEGELFDVHRLGEIIVDSYSGESLGRDESRVAVLQIVRVEAKLSYGRVVEGAISAEDVAANRVLCRPSRAVAHEPESASKSSIQPPTAEQGVKLPFD